MANVIAKSNLFKVTDRERLKMLAAVVGCEVEQRGEYNLLYSEDAFNSLFNNFLIELPVGNPINSETKTTTIFQELQTLLPVGQFAALEEIGINEENGYSWADVYVISPNQIIKSNTQTAGYRILTEASIQERYLPDPKNMEFLQVNEFGGVQYIMEGYMDAYNKQEKERSKAIRASIPEDVRKANMLKTAAEAYPELIEDGYTPEQIVAGYTVAGHDMSDAVFHPEAEHIQRIDELNMFEGDGEAAIQAEKDGYDLFFYKGLGYLNTEKNLKLLQKHLAAKGEK